MSYYGVSVAESNIRPALIALNILYKDMPETEGCENCALHNGDNVCWCCLTQNPSMYYVEFLNIWEKVQQWSKAKKLPVILRAVRNYLTADKEKGCIFFDDGCLIYETRPFACRMYGVISPVGWQRRWDALREREGSEFRAREQCNLVQLKSSGEPGATTPSFISEAQEDNWFLHTRRCEAMLGVTPQQLALHDRPLGTYRTFHDHLLLQCFGENFLCTLTQMRLSKPSNEDIGKLLVTVKSLYEGGE
jgi:Fe-S-cluster containining protein